MDYVRFFLNNKRLISFGFFLTFFSSFGQTFLISLYVPDIITSFQLNNSSFGVLYGAATIISSLTLAYVGKFVDYWNLRSYSVSAVVLLIASCLLISFSFNLLVLFIGFWGLRLAGQGLLSHISSTSISKFFTETRGKALSLSVLGYSIGEGFFSIAVGALIGVIGWRNSMLLNAAFIGLILLPFIVIALNKQEFRSPSRDVPRGQGTPDFSRSQLLRDKGFYVVALNSFILPFIITGLFFYQRALADEKGWSVALISVSFVGYAAGRTIFSLISGRLVDRYSALSLFPFYLIPFIAGLLALTMSNAPVIAPLYLALTGVSMGLGSTIKAAVLAELYGTGNLGSVKSLFATLMVSSTAISPALFGFLLDHGLGFRGIVIISICLASIASGISFRVRPVFEAQFQAAPARQIP